MKFSRFLKDKTLYIVSWLFGGLLAVLIMRLFKCPAPRCVSIGVIFVFIALCLPAAEYFLKKGYYQNLLENRRQMDKAWLVGETVSDPSFYEGEICRQIISDMSLSMNNNVNRYKRQLKEFKEYIEMWIHQVKIPLSALVLIAHNSKGEIDPAINRQIGAIEDYVEQVLYYSRAENSEKDYMIISTSLSKAVHDGDFVNNLI